MKKTLLKTLLIMTLGLFTINTSIAQNMDNYIKVSLESDEVIPLYLWGNGEVKIKIVSGESEQTMTIGDAWSIVNDYQPAAKTITIYGDLKKFSTIENGSKLVGIDISHNSSIEELLCRDNEISELELGDNTSLTGLFCQNNKLTELDVTKLINLKKLYCQNNELKQIDLSHNLALQFADLGRNNLTELFVGSNTALISLACDNNKLTELDVSNNLELLIFKFYNNSFTTEGYDKVFCSLPDRSDLSEANIYPLNNKEDAGHETVLASNKQNAIDKHWAVYYYDNYNGDLHDKNIPATTGSYSCTSSREEYAIEEVSIYPNPIQDILNINSKEDFEQIEIYNIVGQLYYSSTSNEKNISLKYLPKGTYIVKLKTKTTTYNKKVVKM